jgi:signal transduction histidine kinase
MLRAVGCMQPTAKGEGLLDRNALTGYLRQMPARVPSAPRFGLLIFAAWLVPALLSGFNTYMQARLGGRPPDWHWILFNSIDWLIYALLTPFVFRASRRLPLARPHLLRNISLNVLGALAMCVAWALLGTLLRLQIFPHQGSTPAQNLWVDFLSWVFITLPFGVGVYFALVGIEHSFFYFAQARERETQAARLAAQLSEARLGALRMQLNPHFLFNSLNAITVLVRDQDTAAASRTLELLSDLLRQVLRNDQSHETTLSRELEFLQRYLAIEQVRFSDRLRPRIDINPALARAAVPSFLLQHLVENAIRHGIARRADAGRVEVSAARENDQLVLTVRDDGPGFFVAATESGVGLSNTRARLAALYGGNATLQVENAEGGGVIATVRLPYHEAQEDA